MDQYVCIWAVEDDVLESAIPEYAVNKKSQVPTNSPVAATKCLRMVDVSSADLGVAKPNIGLLRPWLTCRLIDDMIDYKTSCKMIRGRIGPGTKARKQGQKKTKTEPMTEGGLAVTFIYHSLPSFSRSNAVTSSRRLERLRAGNHTEVSMQGGGTKQKAHPMQAVPRRRIDG